MTSITINKAQDLFEIHNGSTGLYTLSDIKSCSVLNEDARFKGKSCMFSNTINEKSMSPMQYLVRNVYVGLKIITKTHEALYVYISEDAVLFNSVRYKEDKKNACKIKEILDKL